LLVPAQTCRRIQSGKRGRGEGKKKKNDANAPAPFTCALSSPAGTCGKGNPQTGKERKGGGGSRESTGIIHRPVQINLVTRRTKFRRGKRRKEGGERKNEILQLAHKRILASAKLIELRIFRKKSPSHREGKRERKKRKSTICLSAYRTAAVARGIVAAAQKGEEKGRKGEKKEKKKKKN